jgi:ABC-2 type transport system ATP-binding protein
MTNAFELRSVTKRFGETTALNVVTLAVPRESIVGLIGRNGSGKSTLLRSVVGLYLPDAGECVTLGRPTRDLGREELARIGFADQHASLIEWMSGRQLLDYVSTFYSTWDRALERRLVAELDVNTNERVGAMSPGNLQKLSLVLASAHRPSLLLLDEPLSDLDPIARHSVLLMLLDRFSSDETTIVISSHMLRDIEPVVNRIVCLDRGRVVADDELDVLHDRYAEWIVTSADGSLPQRFDQSYVLSSEGDRRHARLIVRDAQSSAEQFAAVYGASIAMSPLNLEKIFRLLTGARSVSGAGGDARTAE